jgi:hypothetical protein
MAAVGGARRQRYRRSSGGARYHPSIPNVEWDESGAKEYGATDISVS